jgi:microcompartment protein CcmK/EutM
MNNIGSYTTNSEVSTLLVLRHSSNSVGIVQSVAPNGNLIELEPNSNGLDTIMRIDSTVSSFTDFYADFYHQLKDPSEYSFFKVTEFEAHETAKGLQEYVDSLSTIEKEELKKYEVSIDTVDALRNEKDLEIDGSDQESFYKKSISMADNPKYRFQVEDVNWVVMADIGLDKEKLQELGVLESLLKGYKTAILIPVKCSSGKDGSREEARLQLRVDDNGEVVAHIHQVQKMPDFRKKFLGHRFSKEDRLNLLNSGNMGRVVGLVNSVTGEVIPSLVSLDKLTNELFSLRMEFVRIPAVVCGVVLSEEQKQVLRSGKLLFVENMLSKSKRLFNATLQFNAEKQWLEFFFNKRMKRKDRSEVGIPTTFRGKFLRKWQTDKLRVGESAYIDGLVSERGNVYQGYIRFDKVVGRIVFSFKKPI